jgi:cytochrome c553
MNKLLLAGFAVVCLAPLAIPMLSATPDQFPNWAFPVNPPPAPGAPRAQAAKDDGTLFHVPDSDVALTRAQIEGPNALPDWHPNDHPPMPDIIAKGRDGVRACAYCHQPNGAGRPENASLAGLTETYIKEQIDTFRKGLRKGSEPNRVPETLMNQIAAKVTDEDVDEAAKYFSTLKLPSFMKVVETDTVPKTIISGGMLAKAADGGTEPIGQRIIEVPEDSQRAENRDPRTTYVAYVPKGSIAKGKALVTGGPQPCISCHGPELHGLGDIPHIGGRSPSYIVRQLYDVQHGNRSGGIAPMQQVVSAFTTEDMIAVAAYVASREP